MIISGFGRLAAARAVFLAACAMGFIAAQPSLAQEAAGTPPAPTWTINCSGAAGQAKLACTLTQTLIMKDKGQRVLTAVVTNNDGKPLLNLGLPHGLNLPKGVDIWIDDKARQNFPIVTADQKGSYAIVALKDTFIAAMKQGKLLNVAITAFAGDEIILQLSLNGFSAGFTKL
ncbi:invasion associated locus B family protein [Mesorhizobium sp. LHD-90]|uniref:invasion associated locus B family protein n=1 Tax=Mesorhizobium sp. LHD-90 TaxID=3071414 RepID=UPI0027DF2B15|nr:invasion associated locus B family protein [Mesorhizobium sp. LHD-90]MDQ6434694.1 invasion associated locus B family protein [Mesorhizobium sp. LHD-90]